MFDVKDITTQDLSIKEYFVFEGVEEFHKKLNDLSYTIKINKFLGY